MIYNPRQIERKCDVERHALLFKHMERCHNEIDQNVGNSVSSRQVIILPLKLQELKYF